MHLIKNHTARHYPLLKKIFFLSLCLLISHALFSQSKKIDSLKNLSQSLQGTALINIYNELSSELRTINADSGFFFAKKALEISLKEGDKKQEALSRLSLGASYHNNSNYELSVEQLSLAEQMGKELNDKQIMGTALAAVGMSKWVNGKIDEALAYNFRAVKLFDDIKDNKGSARAFVNISMIYQTQNNLILAEKYAKQSLELNKLANDPRTQIKALHTLANILGIQGKFNEALKIDSTGLEITKSTDNYFFSSTFYDNMANCYMYSNRYEDAEINFRKCIVIDSSFDNKKNMADTYLNLGNLYLMQKKIPQAIQLLDHSIDLSREGKYKQGEQQALLFLSDAYKQKGSYEEAFNYLKQSHAIEDSILNIASVNKIAELETVYQTEKKEQQLKLQNAVIQKKNYLLWGIGFIGLLLAIVVFSIYRRKKVQNKFILQQAIMKQQDIATKAIIEAEENERKRIAADLHDGVGQMMSAAKMNLSVFEAELPFVNEAQKISFENVIGLVDESCKEIRSVSHQMMPNALLKSGLASAVKEFIDKIDTRVIKVTLHTEGLSERVDNNTETVLYRVIQECVNNVLKHSGADHLDISLIKDLDGIAVTIEDNGKGFDSSDKLKFDGIGLKNIISRINYLKGTIDFDSAAGKGTLVAIHVPVG